MANYVACLRRVPRSKTDQFLLKPLLDRRIDMFGGNITRETTAAWSYPEPTSCVHVSMVILLKP